MSWTTPRTWVQGELVTHDLLNTQIRDNLTDLNGRIVAPSGNALQVLKGDSTWGYITYVPLTSLAGFPSDASQVLRGNGTWGW